MVWCKIGLKLSVATLRRILVVLKRRAEQTGTSLDDIAIQAVEEVIDLYDKGEIEKLLCE